MTGTDSLDHLPRRGRRVSLMRAVLAAALGLGLAAQGQAADVSRDLKVRELRPGVWLHTSWRVLPDGKRFPSNGLVVREGDHLLLIDTAGGEPLTEALFKWIDGTLRLPVRAAIVTHAHDDRLGGAPVLVRRGIPFYGRPMTRTIALEQKLPPPQGLRGLAAVGGTDHVGSAEVFYPGPAHTRDNVVVWLPESRVLFGGCAVRAASDTSLGNLADADVKEFPASIRRVLERYPTTDVVVPGHGEPGGRELLEHTLALLTPKPVR